MFEALQKKYIASFQGKIKDLKSALEHQDAQALSAQVHQLAGSSGSYGFTDISKLCDQIEQQLHEHEQLNPIVTEQSQQLLTLMQQALNKK